MTVISLVTWVESVIAATIEAAAEERRLIHSPLKGVKFKNRPNIYLIVYDGYGNKRLHREVFGVDNSAIYQELAARNFKVLDTYSNYWGTWESMLSVFLADHHYYDLMNGVFDSKIGRRVMNGTAFNPVLSCSKAMVIRYSTSRQRTTWSRTRAIWITCIRMQANPCTPDYAYSTIHCSTVFRP